MPIAQACPDKTGLILNPDQVRSRRPVWRDARKYLFFMPGSDAAVLAQGGQILGQFQAG